MNGLYDQFRLALHGVWTRRWLVLGIAWGVAVLGWLIVAQIPNRYESSAKVFVQTASILPTQVGITPQDQQKGIDTIRQTLTSAANLEKVVRGTDLANGASTDKQVQDAVAGLSNAITVKAEQDNLLSITASASSPKLARQIVQKLIDIFVEENLRGTRDETSDSLKFLDAQLAQREQQLQQADQKRQQFQSQYLGSLPGTGSLADRIGAARSQMAQIDGDLASAESSLAAVNGQMAGTTPTVAGQATASYGPARARLAAIQGQIADARARGWTDNHPDMVALKSQLAQAEAAAAHEPLGSGGGASANPLYLSLRSMQAEKAAQVAALKQRKGALQGDLNQLSAKLAGDPQAAAEQSDIERNYQVLKDQYDKLLASREEVRIRGQAQSQTDAVRFNVISAPTESRMPASPNRPLLLTGVLLAAIAAAIGAAFGLGQMRTTFATPAALEAASGLPVIGAIGEMVTEAQRSLRARRLKLFVGGAAALGCAWIALLGVEFLQRGLAA